MEIAQPRKKKIGRRIRRHRSPDVNWNRNKKRLHRSLSKGKRELFHKRFMKALGECRHKTRSVGELGGGAQGWGPPPSSLDEEENRPGNASGGGKREKNWQNQLTGKERKPKGGGAEG